jgi:hypothetical protein
MTKRPTKRAPARPAEPTVRKLVLKKDTLRDLAVPARAGRQPKGGRSSGGSSIAGSIAGSDVT